MAVALTERLQKRFRKAVPSDCYLLTQHAVMLRVGVTIKQIENKHLHNLLIFRV